MLYLSQCHWGRFSLATFGDKGDGSLWLVFCHYYLIYIVQLKKGLLFMFSYLALSSKITTNLNN